MIKKLLTLSLMLSLTANAIADARGTCGNNLKWYYQEASKTLTISGTGQMGFFESSIWKDYAFTHVIIEEGVTSIGYKAFLNCSSLTSITIPNSLTDIYSQAFFGCSGLTSITIPESVTYIGDRAFDNCFSLTSITIPNSVTDIGDWAFSGCSNLTSIAIPESVTRIGDGAFEGTPWFNNQPDGLVYAGKVAYKYKGTMPENTSIIIKDGSLSISESAFYSCGGLTSITIPNSVTGIGDSAFLYCYGLTSITIPEGVSSIGNYAFYGCSNLSSITIPESVTRIGNGAFEGTPWFNNQPEGLVYAGIVAYKYKGAMLHT